MWACINSAVVSVATFSSSGIIIGCYTNGSDQYKIVPTYFILVCLIGFWCRDFLFLIRYSLVKFISSWNWKLNLKTKLEKADFPLNDVIICYESVLQVILLYYFHQKTVFKNNPWENIKKKTHQEGCTVFLHTHRCVLRRSHK